MEEGWLTVGLARAEYTQPAGKQPPAAAHYRPLWAQVRSRQLYDMQCAPLSVPPVERAFKSALKWFGGREDPHETVNVAGNASYAAVAKQLAAQLQEMLGE